MEVRALGRGSWWRYQRTQRAEGGGEEILVGIRHSGCWSLSSLTSLLTFWISFVCQNTFFFICICKFFFFTSSKRLSGQSSWQLFPGEMKHSTKSPGISDTHINLSFPPQDTLACLPRTKAYVSLPEGFLWLWNPLCSLRQSGASPIGLMPQRAAFNQWLMRVGIYIPQPLRLDFHQPFSLSSVGTEQSCFDELSYRSGFGEILGLSTSSWVSSEERLLLVTFSSQEHSCCFFYLYSHYIQSQKRHSLQNSLSFCFLSRWWTTSYF